jgi:curved DNA-binding protein CbpA
MELYSVLGVSRDCSSADVRRAYLVKARDLHPDKNPSSDAKEQFQALSRAYQVLSDPQERQRYDATGKLEEDMSPEEAFAEYLKRYTEASVSEQDILNIIAREQTERNAKDIKVTQEEERVIEEQYVKHEGKLSSIMQFVMCSKKDAQMYVNKCIQEGKLPALKHWKTTSNNKRKRK